MAVSKEIDKASINQIIKQFFGIFNNKDRSTHNWDRIFEICIPETMVLKKDSLGQTVYNLKDFIEPRKQILTDGTLSDFEEYETEEQTIITGNIAQRRSRYQKNGCINKQQFSGAGTKLFHLVRTVKGWQIAAVTWEDDRDE